MGVAIGLSGRIGTGKTSVASRVSARLSCPMTSFSSFLRREADTRGREINREILQELGADWMERGWSRFCRAILDDVGWQQGQSLVVDGVRHEKVVNVFREIVAPDPFVLVYLDPPEAAQWERRLRSKGISTLLELNELELHPAEGEVARLRELADLIPETARPADQIAGEVVAAVREALDGH